MIEIFIRLLNRKFRSITFWGYAIFLICTIITMINYSNSSISMKSRLVGLAAIVLTAIGRKRDLENPALAPSTEFEAWAGKKYVKLSRWIGIGVFITFAISMFGFHFGDSIDSMMNLARITAAAIILISGLCLVLYLRAVTASEEGIFPADYAAESEELDSTV